MSFTILPVFDPYRTPVVTDTPTAADRQHAHDEATRQRHHHPHPEAALPEEADLASLDLESLPVGTLIDVQA
jgi:hypothetical protein